MSGATLGSRFAGALLGTMVGDTLGAPFEGQPHERMADRRDELRDNAVEWMRRSRYTDDTQMMIGVAESLVAARGFDADDMALRFAANYDPYRGYGAGAHRVLSAIGSGWPWHVAATRAFPEGSFGNGAAMRVAPVGVLYHDDLAELRRVAEGSAAITHAHPLGKEGAALQACAVALAIRAEGGSAQPLRFLGELSAFARSDLPEFTDKLESMTTLLREKPDVESIVRTLGNDIRAHGSVAAAIYAFLAHIDSFEAAVVYAVTLGGDTDTIGAMTGAIAGASHGVEAIPQEWRDALESGPKGRDHVMQLAHELAKVRDGWRSHSRESE